MQQCQAIQWTHKKTVQGFADLAIVGQYQINILTYLPLLEGVGGKESFHLSILNRETDSVLYSEGVKPGKATFEDLKKSAMAKVQFIQSRTTNRCRGRQMNSGYARVSPADKHTENQID